MKAIENDDLLLQSQMIIADEVEWTEFHIFSPVLFLQYVVLHCHGAHNIFPFNPLCMLPCKNYGMLVYIKFILNCHILLVVRLIVFAITIEFQKQISYDSVSYLIYFFIWNVI